MRKSTLVLAAAMLFMASATQALELTAAHVNPPGEPTTVAFDELKERLAKSKTGLSLVVFPQSQVGTGEDAIGQVRLGAITMTAVATSQLSAFAPSADVLNIPFMFRDGDRHPWAVVDGPIGAELAEQIKKESGLEVIGWWSAGFRHVFTKKTDVKTPEDMEGKKIRVIGSPVYLDTFNTLGAQATPMPYGEVYTGLATGTIDAAENDTSGYRNMGFWEQAPHLSLTGHIFAVKIVVANPDKMKEMTPEQRAEFDAIFKDITLFERDLFNKGFEDDLAFLRSKGVTITEPDREAFVEKSKPVIDKYAQKFGVELVQRIRDAK